MDLTFSPTELAFRDELRDWFAATERYPRQLHEIELTDYLAMKRKEVRRQKELAALAQ